MLAGAVSRGDDLFLHVGFSTLEAISPTGQIRPFHKHADGLLPAEGASFVALKRLSDAVRMATPSTESFAASVFRTMDAAPA